ncbi:MAG: AAA family ATPase [Magnetococcales bacterium]|nr:AAA family ATPase [Magnetococcales bacterium]
MDPLPLTRRQIEILKLIQAGCSNKEVARRLDISDGTVKQHLVEIFRRLKVNNRTKAAQLVTQSEEESFFLASVKKEEPVRNRSASKMPEALSATLQPMHCVRIRARSPKDLLHRLGSERFNRYNRLLREACDQAARRFEGVVQGSIEGPLVLFGIRFMREDDPLRAVCCAGMIMDLLARELTALALDDSWIEITVYSVQVVTCTDGAATTIQGELIHHEEEAGSGASINLGPGIVLSAGTAGAVGRVFVRYGMLSPLLPGSGVLRGWDLSRDRWQDPPFVGRDTELDELHRRLANALKGETEATLVVGEAGFGETRLIRQLHLETVNRRDVRWLMGTCHTVARMVPLHPFLPILESLARCDLHASPAERWNRLEQWVGGMTAPLERSGRKFLELLREIEPLPRMQIGDGLYEELLNFLVGILPPSPVAVILHLDNLQWMDSFSRMLLPGLASRLNNTHVWLLGAGRKAELRALANHPAMHVLSLLRLPNREILRLLKQMPVARRLDPLQIDLLLEWSRGVPLFAVEIANHLLKLKRSALQETIRAHDLFPDTLACMVMERLQALVGMDWKVIRALAASDPEVPMEQLIAWNLHGDPQATEAVVTHLHQAGVLKILERGPRRFISFGNEMVRAAIRKTMPESDLTP